MKIKRMEKETLVEYNSFQGPTDYRLDSKISDPYRLKNSLNSAVNRSSRTICLKQKSGEDKSIRPEPQETPSGYNILKENENVI
jgi:hypothetical protein